jgi:hypothetical protein
MARQCAVCNQTYPNHLKACPYCQAADPHVVIDDSAVDVGTPPPRTAGDSAASDKALEALLADASPEAIPEGGSGKHEAKPSGVDLHAVVEEVATEEAHADAAPAEVHGHSTDELVDITEEPVLMAEPVSSASGKIPLTAELAEMPSDIVTLVGPEVVEGPPPTAEPHAILDAEPLVVAEPVSSASGVSVAEAEEHIPEIVALAGPESAVHLAQASEPGSEDSVFEVGQAEIIDAGSASSSQVIVAAEAVEPSSAILGVVEEVADVPPASGQPPAQEASPAKDAATPEKKGAAATMLAGKGVGVATMLADPGALADLAASDLGGQKFVSGMPNLELESKARHAAAGDHALDVTDVLEVSEAASGSMHAPPPVDVAAIEAPGVLDEDEILDISEEASSPAMARGHADALDAEEVADADALDAEEVADADALDAEEVLDAEAASGRTERPSGVDMIAEAEDANVVSAEIVPTRRKTSEVDIGGELEAAEVTSSAVNLGALPSGVRKDGSGAVLDEKGIEDLLMSEEAPARAEADEEALEVTDSTGDAALAADLEPEEPVARRQAVSDEEEEEAAPLKFKKGAKKAPRPRRARYVVLGIFLGLLLLGGVTAGAWFVDPARQQVMSLLEVEKKKPPVKPPAPTPLQQAHGFMDKGDYREAVGALEKAGDSPDVLAMRGQARWLKYLQENKEKQLDPKNAEVAKALEDAKAAKNDLLEKQIRSTLDVQHLASAQKVLTELQKVLPKTDDEKAPDVKELAKAFGDIVKGKESAEKDKEKAEKDIAAIAKALKAASLIEDDKKFNSEEFDKVFKDLAGAKALVAGLQADFKAKDGAELAKGVKALSADLSDINEKLKALKIEEPGAAGVAQLVDAQNKLTKDRAELDAAVKAAFDALKQENLAPPGAEARKGLIEATKLAIEKARAPLVISLGQMASAVGTLGANVGGILRGGFDTAKLGGELAYYRTREPLIQTPEQKLDTWVALLQNRDHKDARDLTAARNEAQYVLGDTRASAEARAKAQYVIGLTDRNSGKFEEARQALDQAVKAAAGAKAGPWVNAASRVQRELSDATAYSLPRAERLHASGDDKAALAELDIALQVNPEDGRLHALRGLIRLEMPRLMKPSEETQKLVRLDGEAARKDPRSAADGYYVLGRLEEDLGEMDKAERNYRQALKVHQGSADQASRYMIALARVLQRERLTPPEPPPGEPEPEKKDSKDNKVGRLPAEQAPGASARTTSADARAALLVAALTSLQAVDEEDPEAAGRLRESIELAQKLINSADPRIKGQGYLLLGQAYTKQGKRTEGLQLYAKGLQLAFPGAPTKDLLKLVEDHPAFQVGERAGPPNSFLAERHFGRGLHLFWQAQYPAAEEEFRKAVTYFDQDARYQYYLGLARLQQNSKAKQEAARFNFEQGSRLEAENHPGPVMVNASLERLQGQLRQYLDEYRQRAP